MKNRLETFLYYSVRYSALTLPLTVTAGLFAGGVYTWLGFAIIFGYYFIVESILALSGIGIRSRPEDEFKFDSPDHISFVDRYGVAIYGILQIISVPMGVYLLSRDSMSTLEMVGGILSLGATIGSVGGLAGHEYMHRNDRSERNLGILIYLSVLYGHFFVSHTRGHHRFVGSVDDWSTSRKNESSFAFLYRALFHGYIGAWRLEVHRLRRQKAAFWSNENFMLKVTLASVLLLSIIGLSFGIKAVFIYAGISFLSMSLMEMVNYLSHYGIRREKNSNGEWPVIQNSHSWESNNKVTNWFIFNAGKHCHHHRRPSEAHHQLRLAHDGEFLPYGLPLMTLIGFCPPLFFRLMNPLLTRRQLRERTN